MQRHRDLASSPVRSASELWTVLAQLVTDTTTRSPHITESDVSTALAAAAPAGMMLIAAGHLEREPIVLVAGDVHLSITSVSGDKAFTVEENLNPVPGAAEARDWTLHLPTPEPIGASIATLVAGVAHLSTEPSTAGPSGEDPSSAHASTAPASALNLKALAEREAKR
jgi:hypothetical protein